MTEAMTGAGGRFHVVHLMFDSSLTEGQPWSA